MFVAWWLCGWGSGVWDFDGCFRPVTDTALGAAVVGAQPDRPLHGSEAEPLVQGPLSGVSQSLQLTVKPPVEVHRIGLDALPDNVLPGVPARAGAGADESSRAADDWEDMLPVQGFGSAGEFEDLADSDESW